MTTVQVRDIKGEVIAFVQGTSLLEADRLARRKHPGAASVELVEQSGSTAAAGAPRVRVPLREAAPDVEAQLKTAFKRIGLSESSAKIAAAGRGGRRSDVPSRTVESATAAPTSTRTPLEEAFKRLGLPVDQAAIAAAGRRR